ncbi:MAG TPA: hypothetical protein VEB21_13275 [Terriglobales bacterium]|nr:hypothetical protein [Terriglobales bacterium]
MLLRLVLTVLLFGSTAAWAAEEDAKIEARVDSYFDTLRQGDWPAAAGHFSGRAQKQFRSMFTEVLDAVPQAEKDQAYAAFFGDNVSPKQVGVLSDRDFMAKFFSGMLGRVMKTIAVGSNNVVGTVYEKSDLAHVVSRTTVTGPGGVTAERMMVTSVEKDGDRWALALTGEIEGAAAAIRAQLKAREAAEKEAAEQK